ncbi:putative nuclease HARBI1 [Pleurodeles waltl]|uniref:putative nuclease HARBI1 n=1 Tax=Pleurodeles waltl TaxID=8319 RepID=UPI0037095BED
MAALYAVVRRMRILGTQQRRRRRRERIFRQRLTLFEQTDEEVYARYRFTKEVILSLINELDPVLSRSTQRSVAIPTHIQVLCSLHLLASGGYQHNVAVTGGISQSALCRVFQNFIEAMLGRINSHISFPSTPADLESTKNEFHEVAHFPQVLGCVDSTHILICPPSDTEYVYRNRKGQHSLNIQVVCNAKCLITDLVARYPGSTQDCYIFRHCGLYERLSRGDFGDGWLLGDSAYFIRPWIMTPYLEPGTPRQRRYNAAHKQTRSIIDKTCGLLRGRFRCLHKSGGALQYDPTMCCKIIATCAMLHNLAVRWSLPNEAASDDSEEEEDEIPPSLPHPDPDAARADEGRARREDVTNNYF